MQLLTLSQTGNFRLFKTEKKKKNADDDFKFDENGRKFSKTYRKHCGEKGEIARYEQCLLFPPQCFQKTCNADS